MAKRTKPPGNGGRRKPTRRDKAGPPRGPQLVVDVEAERKRQAEAFERHRTQQLARAALELDPMDAEILKLAVVHPGLTQEQIGDLVGLGRQAVNERMNAEKFKRAIAIATRTAIEIFDANKAAAARKLGELIQSKNDYVSLRAAVAHLWPHIHTSAKDGGTDAFVSFVQEAFELATKSAEEEGGAPAAPAPAALEGKAGA